MPKLHPLASVYIYERMNDEGLVAVANSPYPLIVSGLVLKLCSTDMLF